jgi:hypothetical protein
MNAKQLEAAVAIKVRERERGQNIEAAKKRSVEIIQFRVIDKNGEPFLDELGAILKSSEFKVQRRNLKRGSIMDGLRKTPVPFMEIDFFIDNVGTALWLDDLKSQALTSPAFYVVVPIANRIPHDIANDPQYEGQTILIAQDVPLYCIDGSYPVDQVTLKEWMLYAIIEDDHTMAPFHEAVAAERARLIPLDKNLRQIANTKYVEFNGQPMVGERLLKLRKDAVALNMKQKREVGIGSGLGLGLELGLE